MKSRGEGAFEGRWTRDSSCDDGLEAPTRGLSRQPWLGPRVGLAATRWAAGAYGVRR